MREKEPKKVFYERDGVRQGVVTGEPCGIDSGQSDATLDGPVETATGKIVPV